MWHRVLFNLIVIQYYTSKFLYQINNTIKISRSIIYLFVFYLFNLSKSMQQLVEIKAAVHSFILRMAHNWYDFKAH